MENPDNPLEQNIPLERLKSLYELIARMNSEADPQTLLDFVVDKVLSITGGQQGLLLLNDEHDDTRLQHLAVIKGSKIKQSLDEVLEFVSTTVIQDVLEQGEPRMVYDLPTDARYESIASDATLRLKRVRSVMAVPLKVAQQLVGLIYIDHPRRASFAEGDLDFLTAFAAQAALSINRARIHQRQIEDLTRLNALSQSVVQVLDLNQVLTRIINEANRMLNVESGSVLLLNEPDNDLSFAISVANGSRVQITAHLDKDQGIAGWILANRKPVCINDVSQDPRWFGEVEDGFVTRSLLCVPLMHNNQVLGVVQALNKKSPYGFTDGDIALLSTFATSATIAIVNARLFQEATQARQLRDLNDVALTLSSTLDLTAILKTGLERALSALSMQAGAISLCENRISTTNKPTLHVSRGLSNDFSVAKEQIRSIEALSEWALARGGDEPIILTVENPQSAPASEFLFEAGFETLILMPMTGDDKISGVLTILSAAGQENAEQLNFLVGIARIIGLSVQNATHYDQVRAQTVHLAYLNEIGGALTRSLELGTVLKVVIEGVNALLETERASVFLIDRDTNELVLRYTNEGDADIRLEAPWQGIAGWVAQNDQPCLVNDTLSDPRHLRKIAIETGYEAHSILCVPIKIEDQVIGVVEVLNKQGDRQFTHRHQAMLIEFTKWAAIALHNAHLFEARLQAYQHLADEQDRRIAAETRGTMAAIVLDMAHTMNNVIGAIRAWSSTLEFAAQAKPDTAISQYAAKIGNIRKNAEEALKLIGDITDPLEQPTIAPTNLHRCLDRAIKSCWWPDNVRLRQDFSPDIPPVQANAKRLEAVFHNLLSNSIQALTRQSGGEICVRTHHTRHGTVEITVADNGPGIPPELQEHIFKPAISGTEGGMGLGLWLVETFISQFDGGITFASSPETETTFTVTLNGV